MINAKTSTPVGERVRHLVSKWFNGSVNRAAEHYGIMQPTLHRIATGAAKNPRGDVLLKIARAHSTIVDWLMTGEGPEPQAPKMSRRDQLRSMSKTAMIDLILSSEEKKHQT